MTSANSEIHIQHSECITLEFGDNLPSSPARELAVFANIIEGKLLSGVRDYGVVIGVRDSDVQRAHIRNAARDPSVKVVVHAIDGVPVMCVRKSSASPAHYRDSFFRCWGAAIQKMNPNKIRDFSRRKSLFDISSYPRFVYSEDFDCYKFDALFGLSGVGGGLPVADVLVNIEVVGRALDKLPLRKMLFFAKNACGFFLEAYVICSPERSDDKKHGRKDFHDGIVDVFENTTRFVERNTRTTCRTTCRGMKRQNVSGYPMEVGREATTRAVRHHHRFFEVTNVFVEICTDTGGKLRRPAQGLAHGRSWAHEHPTEPGRRRSVPSRRLRRKGGHGYPSHGRQCTATGIFGAGVRSRVLRYRHLRSGSGGSTGGGVGRGAPRVTLEAYCLLTVISCETTRIRL